MTSTVFRSSKQAPPTLTQLLSITGIKEEMPRIVYKKGGKEITLLEITPAKDQEIPRKLTKRNFSSLRGPFGKTVLIAAAEKGLDDVVNAVIAVLEETPLKKRQTFMMTKFNVGYTALDRAKSWECFKAIAQAYNGSTSWPQKPAKGKLTLSELLGYTGDRTIRSALINRLFEKNEEFSKKNKEFTQAIVNQKNLAKETPIFRHVRLGAITAINFLVAYGADVNTANSEGQTPLHIACADPRLLKTAELLLQKQADINAEDKEGKTPFEIATDARNTAAVKLLMTFSQGRKKKTRRRSQTDPRGKKTPSKTSIPISTQTSPGTQVLVDGDTLAELRLPPRKQPTQPSEYTGFGVLVTQNPTSPTKKKDSTPMQYGALKGLIRPRSTSLRRPRRLSPRAKLTDAFKKRFHRHSLRLDSPPSPEDTP